MSSQGISVGYVRVSTTSQDEALQHEALDKAGVLKRNRYVDHGVSGSRHSRPGLDAMLSDVNTGDKVVVYKLDRLGRSTAHVVGLIHDLTERGVFIESVADGLNSSTPTGRAMLQMLAIFSEMERSFIQERTRAGLAEARKAGRVGGRRAKLGVSQVKQAQVLRDAGTPVQDISRTLGVSIATVYRATRGASASGI
ncbi:recombinase family protein [Leucobacter japonicus]|uniref:recombinase family protein n=1 Tax=Leucobacter japonicus TaxID=1461259 RepID=UPI0009E3D57C|nr:recombinase family protein [Leucobacter japonicus]